MKTNHLYTRGKEKTSRKNSRKNSKNSGDGKSDE
jgi:hypothetical protein